MCCRTDPGLRASYIVCGCTKALALLLPERGPQGLVQPHRLDFFPFVEQRIGTGRHDDSVRVQPAAGVQCPAHMSIHFNSDDSIVLDGVATGLKYTQEENCTVIYSVGHGGVQLKRYPMPHARYLLPYDTWRPRNVTSKLSPKASSTAGRMQFETDLRALVQSIAS